jgi:hypothetical protein
VPLRRIGALEVDQLQRRVTVAEQPRVADRLAEIVGSALADGAQLGDFRAVRTGDDHEQPVVAAGPDGAQQREGRVRLFELPEHQHPRVQVREFDPRLLAALGTLGCESIGQELVN